MKNFRRYQNRAITFRENIQTKGWQIKIYIISHQAIFDAESTLVSAIKKLPDWINDVEQSDLLNYKTGFLIVHEGSDGIWTLFYWWTEGEMLGSQLFFSATDEPQQLQKNPHSFSLVCIWELEVIQYERAIWIQHILSKATAPDFDSYLQGYLNKPSV